MKNDLDKVSDVVKENRYLQFDLGEEFYALELLTVKEVIPCPETTNLPNCPSYYVGIMNLRGQIISIIDLRKKLGVSNASKSEDELEEAVIIIEISGIAMGLIVDSINRVLSFTSNDLIEVPEINTQVNAKYIAGVFQKEDALIMLLDLEKVFNIKEIEAMQEKAA